MINSGPENLPHCCHGNESWATRYEYCRPKFWPSQTASFLRPVKLGPFSPPGHQHLRTCHVLLPPLLLPIIPYAHYRSEALLVDYVGNETGKGSGATDATSSVDRDNDLWPTCTTPNPLKATQHSTLVVIRTNSSALFNHCWHHGGLALGRSRLDLGDGWFPREGGGVVVLI